MRRHLLGIVAVLLFAGAVAFWIWPPEGAAAQQFEAACWRVGALVAVFWLAYPQLYRVPSWLWPALTVSLAVLAIRPKYFVLAVPIIVALAILRPRIGRRR